MASIGVALPLALDDNDGFVMLKSFKKTIKQNFKMLLLTNPGERVMDPNFGVGMKTYLFENHHDNLGAEIETKIRKQVDTYMPAIDILNIAFDASSIDSNKLGVAITYAIPDIGVKDLLRFTI